MAAGGCPTETEKLLEEYTKLRKIIANHNMHLGRTEKSNRSVVKTSLANSNTKPVDFETIKLVNEYENLKRMITNHKKYNQPVSYASKKKNKISNFRFSKTSPSTFVTSSGNSPFINKTSYPATNYSTSLISHPVSGYQNVSSQFSLSSSRHILNKSNKTVLPKLSQMKFVRTSPIKTAPNTNNNKVAATTSTSNNANDLLKKKGKNVSLTSRFKFEKNSRRPSLIANKSPLSIRKQPNVLGLSVRKQPNVMSKYKIVNYSSHKRSNMKRTVKKYSVKYLPVQSNAKKGNLLPKTKQQATSKRDKNSKNLNLVKIGGVFYKSSRTKLTKTCKNSNKFLPKSKEKETNKKLPALNLLFNKSKVVTVRGVKFALNAGRKSLQRIGEPVNSKSSVNDNSTTKSCLPVSIKRVDIGGVTFHETQPGILTPSLYRTRVVNMASRVVNRSRICLNASSKKSKQYCLFYNKFGVCKKKENGSCPFIHDPSKIAVCSRFLHGGCTVADCPFSHELCRNKMPVCNFFLHGRCSSDECPYLHVNMNPDVGICEDFQKGFCPSGEKCKLWHVSGRDKKDNDMQKKTRKRDEAVPKRHNEKQNLELPRSLEESSTKEIDSYSNQKKLDVLPSFIPLNESSSSFSMEESLSEAIPIQIRPGFMGLRPLT